MTKQAQVHVTIYDCGICGSYHPLNFSGDCRDDTNRFATPEDYAEYAGIDPDLVVVLDWDVVNGDPCELDSEEIGDD